MRAVWASPTGRMGLAAVAVSRAVMVGVMVMTPVHMGHAGGSEETTLRVIGLLISVHVAGMYLFSPLVGMLADRAGRRTTVGVGGGLLLTAAALAGVVRGPLLAVGGFGLVTGVSAALLVPLAAVWVRSTRRAVSDPAGS